MTDLPRIISVDDHVVEPPTLWWDRLPAGRRESGPRVVRQHGVAVKTPQGFRIVEDDGPGARWGDVWVYDDMVWPFLVGFAIVGQDRDSSHPTEEPITYDEMSPGCYEQAARLADMDLNHVEASMCFPTVPRFCGQIFLERRDKDLALECLRIYNDWMVDEWCGGAGRGRLVPLTLVPLWDPVLAAEEVRRCADRGAGSVCFPEALHPLGLPTLFSGAWEPFLEACDETGTVINMHIGSSSQMPTTSPDAPVRVRVPLTHQNGVRALVDWVLSGVLVRHPGIKVALSEAQAGWMPFILQRMDDLWERGDTYEAEIRELLPEPPSQLIRGRVFSCIFNDLVGLAARDQLGMEHLMFETDYPHADSTFPHSARTAEELVRAAGLDEHETWQFLRGNAIACYGLERFGVAEGKVAVHGG